MHAIYLLFCEKYGGGEDLPAGGEKGGGEMAGEIHALLPVDRLSGGGGDDEEARRGRDVQGVSDGAVEVVHALFDGCCEVRGGGGRGGGDEVRTVHGGEGADASAEVRGARKDLRVGSWERERAYFRDL